jgi:hypothetical protein
MSVLIGFIPPCLPTKAPQPPSGNAWLHEIKHDGFRVIARPPRQTCCSLVTDMDFATFFARATAFVSAPEGLR